MSTWNRSKEPRVPSCFLVVSIIPMLPRAQFALDLLSMDYQVFVCADAVGSRGRVDYERALLRIQHAGAAITTVESALFELCERSGTDRFRGLLEVIKSSPPPVD